MLRYSTRTTLHLTFHYFLQLLKIYIILIFKLRRISSRNYDHNLLSQVSFPLVLPLLNQRCIPPLRLHISDCGTYLIMCDVRCPIAAVSCTESTEYYLGIVSIYF
jgi:hypothetical protein